MAKDASLAAPAAPPEPPADDRPAVKEGDVLASALLRAARRLRLLQELSEIGMDLTRSLRRRVAAADALPLAEAKRDDLASDAAAVRSPRLHAPAKSG